MWRVVKLGIIAALAAGTLSVGGATARNRAKRRVRELFRTGPPARPRADGGTPLDLVVVARPALVDASFAAVEEDFRVALRKLRGVR